MINFIEEINDGMDIVVVNKKYYLFTCNKVDRKTVPDNLYVYDVEDDNGNGNFVKIRPVIGKKHWGTIIGTSPIPMNNGIYYCTGTDGTFIGYTNMDHFLAEKVDLQFIHEGRTDQTEFDTDDIDETKELWGDFSKENNISPCLLTKAIFIFEDGRQVSFTREKEEGWREFFDNIKEYTKANYVWDTNTYISKEMERCNNCVFCIENDDGKWICNDCGKNIHAISDDECKMLFGQFESSVK